MKQLKKRSVLLAVIAVSVSIFVLCGAATGQSAAAVGVKLSSAYTESKNVHLFSNGSEGFLLLSTDGSTTTLSFLNDEGSSNDKNGEAILPTILDYAYSSASTHNNEIYIAGPVKHDSSSLDFGTVVSRYQLDGTSPIFDCSYVLSNIKDSSAPFLTEDSNGNVYALNSVSKNELLVFNSDVTQIPVTITSTHSNFTSVCVSPDNYLYTTYGSQAQLGVMTVKYSSPKIEPKLFSSAIPAIPYRFLNNTTVIDATGAIFNVKGTPPIFYKIFDTKGSVNAVCALEDGSVLCKTGLCTAQKFAPNGTFIQEYSFDGELLDLATNGTVTAAVVKDGSTLRFVDLSKPTTNGKVESETSSSSILSQAESVPSQSTSSETRSNPAGSDPNGAPSSADSSTVSSKVVTAPTKIQSTTYEIDRSAGLLHVGVSTSFSQLKQGIFLQGAVLRAVKLNGSVIESGNIGTGTTIELLVDGKVVDSLTAIVQGDLIGTGSITSRDERILYAHLSSSDHLSGVFLQAADVNGDGIVDTSDLLRLKRLLQNE